MKVSLKSAQEYVVIATVRAPQEALRDFDEHEQLRSTLSRSMRLPLQPLHIQFALHYWRLLEYNVFRTAIGRVGMRSEILHGGKA